jgi:hypothetical protein
MSQENVEIVRRAWEFEMFGRTGSGDPLADFAPDIDRRWEEPSFASLPPTPLHAGFV